MVNVLNFFDFVLHLITFSGNFRVFGEFLVILHISAGDAGVVSLKHTVRKLQQQEGKLRAEIDR